MSGFKKIEEVAGETTERKMPNVSVPTDTNNHPQNNFYDPTADAVGKKETNATEQPAQAPVGKLSKDKALQSGQADAILHDGIQELVLKAAITIRYATRFNETEKETFLASADKTDEERTPAEKSLNKRFLEYTQKFNEQTGRAAMSTPELDNVARAYATYHEITGKETNPALIIAGTIIKNFINKLMDVYIS